MKKKSNICVFFVLWYRCVWLDVFFSPFMFGFLMNEFKNHGMLKTSPFWFGGLLVCIGFVTLIPLKKALNNAIFMKNTQGFNDLKTIDSDSNSNSDSHDNCHQTQNNYQTNKHINP